MDKLPTLEKLTEVVEELHTKIDHIVRLLEEKQSPCADHLLTINQAAELLSLSVPTIYGLVHKQKIPVSKKGKRLYFSKMELIAWVKSGRKKTNNEIELEVENFLNRKCKNIDI